MTATASKAGTTTVDTNPHSGSLGLSTAGWPPKCLGTVALADPRTATHA